MKCFYLILALTFLTTWCPAEPDKMSPAILFQVPDSGSGFLREQPNSLSIQLPVASGKNGDKRPSPDLRPDHLQVWLLKADGTSVPQIAKPTFATIGSFADYAIDYALFEFAQIPTNQVIGVVFRMKGKLHCATVGDSHSSAERAGFSIEPSITPVDPPLRHAVGVNVPTRLKVERTPDSLSIGLDHEQGLQLTNVMVGLNMVTGVQAEWFVYPQGEVRPAASRRTALGGLDFNLGTSILHTQQDGIPVAGKRYVIEVDLTIFETDIPSQHLWAPRSKKYKVLWKRTLKQLVD